MDKEKKAQFVSKMGKKRLRLIKRQYFDSGGIAGLLGAAGGEGGTGFSTNAGTNAAQLNTAYNQDQTAQTGGQTLATTLTPQAQTAVNAQNVLSGQLAQQAQGAGPNVAANTLSQATGANVANQAALMAGQRGAGANPALIAREAAQQGASTQQQAAGQAATMQAQQQIAAEQAQAQLAGNQIAQTQGATTANTQAAQGEQGILQGANTANNNIQGQLANTTMQGQQGLIGGVMGGASSVLSALNKGGEVKTHGLDFVHKMTKMALEHHGKQNYDDGGAVEAQGAMPTFSAPAPKSSGSSGGGGGLLALAALADGGPVVDPAKAQSAQDSMRQAFGGHYADGGLTVPNVAYQVSQNPFMTQAPAQGGFTPGQNAGAQAMKDSTKNMGQKKPDPMASQNANINEDAGKSLAGATPMAPMAGGSDNSFINTNDPTESITQGDKQYAAHGGEMHPKFKGPSKNIFENYFMAKGGEVPAMVSAGEAYLTPEQVSQVVNEDADPKKIGMVFKGKAKVKGDSLKNDTIPATLREGGVVVDREHMGSPEKRKLFVHKAVAKKRAQR